MYKIKVIFVLGGQADITRGLGIFLMHTVKHSHGVYEKMEISRQNVPSVMCLKRQTGKYIYQILFDNLDIKKDTFVIILHRKIQNRNLKTTLRQT